MMCRCCVETLAIILTVGQFEPNAEALGKAHQEDLSPFGGETKQECRRLKTKKVGHIPFY
jgi:hypothetical protein